jgi:hypothetical protein|tara:strand:+ start:834 stop:1271 length:438 start_codon:yes stop_codon:yes gene_type:complete
MKKGKSVKLNLYNPIKSSYGTVDSKKLKSVYINIQSWVTPKFEHDNWNRVVCNLSREIKHSVYNSITTEIFQEKSIVDLDLRTSGISHGKKSFFNLEVNLYTNIELDFKSYEIKESIKKIVKTIFKNNINENKYFDFSTSKKETN